MGHLPNIYFQVLLLLVSGSIFLDAEIISVVVQIDFVFSWGDTNSERSVLLFLWYIQSVFFGGLGDGLKCWKRWVLWESCCFCFFFCMLEMFPFFSNGFPPFFPNVWEIFSNFFLRIPSPKKKQADPSVKHTLQSSNKTWIFQVRKISAFSPKKTTKRQNFYISRGSGYTLEVLGHHSIIPLEKGP